MTKENETSKKFHLIFVIKYFVNVRTKQKQVNYITLCNFYFSFYYINT